MLTRYLTSERSERLRYRVEHEKRKFISTSGHVTFCLLYKHTNNSVFDDFPRPRSQMRDPGNEVGFSEDFRPLSEDFEDFQKLFRRVSERLRTFFEHFPKIAEDFRR